MVWQGCVGKEGSAGKSGDRHLPGGKSKNGRAEGPPPRIAVEHQGRISAHGGAIGYLCAPKGKFGGWVFSKQSLPTSVPELSCGPLGGCPR